MEGLRNRGTRRHQPKVVSDFESTKYDNFFNSPNRKAEEGKTLNIPLLVQNVFNFIYQGKYKDELFSKPSKYQDISILNNLVNNEPLPEKAKGEKTCDEVFYEYLYTFKENTNEKYFTFIMKFILLFRECYNISESKKNPGNKEAATNKLTPEGLPDLCNEFYGDFMEPNNFFDIVEQDNKNEIIEIIQHFCMWIYKNEYTTSKLSLAS